MVLNKSLVKRRNINPFQGHSTGLDIFQRTLAEVNRQAHIPAGYGMLPYEWQSNHYPTSETISSGRSATQQLRISLPHNIWKARAEKWVQALDTLNHTLEILEI